MIKKQVYKMINKLRIKFSKILKPLLKLPGKDIDVNIERSWSTDTAIGIKGIIEVAEGTIDDMEVTVNNITTPVTSWYELPSCEKSRIKDNIGEARGFWVQIPRKAKHSATFKITQANRIKSKAIKFEGSNPIPPIGFTDGEIIYNDFVRRVNDEHLHVLEIGSRVLPPKNHGMKEKFPEAGSYTGFDYYTDSNTDIVGDAHRLSSYFNGKKFDAVFSIAVFEHIAMPWVVAMEINKILKIGGITYNQVPFAWPAHELPWDFWRCSDEGLKVLFSPSMGFDTIKAGMYAPLRMHFDTPITGRERFPEFPCFGCSAILSKKTKELDQEKFRWEVAPKEVLGEESHYPELKK